MLMYLIILLRYIIINDSLQLFFIKGFIVRNYLSDNFDFSVILLTKSYIKCVIHKNHLRD